MLRRQTNRNRKSPIMSSWTSVGRCSTQLWRRSQNLTRSYAIWSCRKRPKMLKLWNLKVPIAVVVECLIINHNIMYVIHLLMAVTDLFLFYSTARMGVYWSLRQTLWHHTQLSARWNCTFTRNVRGDIRDPGRNQVLWRYRAARCLWTGIAEEKKPEHKHNMGHIDNVSEWSPEIDICIVKGIYLIWIGKKIYVDTEHLHLTTWFWIFFQLAGGEICN